MKWLGLRFKQIEDFHIDKNFNNLVCMNSKQLNKLEKLLNHDFIKVLLKIKLIKKNKID